MQTLFLLSLVVTAAMGFHGTFNGASCYSAPPSASIASITAAMTVEFWVYPQSTASMGIAGTWDDVTGNKRTWYVELSNLTPRLLTTPAPTAASGFVSPSQLPVAQWSHVAFTKSASGTAKLYVNGWHVATGTLPASIHVNSEPMRVGCSYFGGSQKFLNANLDHLRLWSVERSIEEIQVGMTSCGAPPGAGLVAQYTFDEGTGTTLTDSSGNGNDAATSHGTPGWNAGNAPGLVCGTPSPAAQFHGNFSGGSCFAALPSASLNTITAAMTLEFWVYPQSTSQMGIAGTWDDITGSKRTWYVELFNLKPGLFTTQHPAAVSSFTSPSAIPIAQWTHVAFTKSVSGAAKLYVNGVNIASGTLPASIHVNNEPMEVGCVYAGGSPPKYLHGYLENVRLWNVVRNSTEIQDGMAACGTPSGVGLIAQYKFDEGTGITLKDSSGNGNNAVVRHGAPGWSAGSAPSLVCGVPNPTPQFHGAFVGDSCYAVPSSASVATITAAMTFEFWVYPQSTSQMGIAGTWDDVTGSKRSWYVEVTNLKPQLSTTPLPSGASSFVAPNPLPTAQWSHVAFTKSASGTAKLYVNGAHVATGTLPAFIHVNNEPMRVGCAFAGGSPKFLNGYIDNVRLWNVERNGTEIEDSVTSCGAPSGAGLVAQYTFNQGSGITLHDSSGNDNNGLASHGAPGWGAGSPPSLVCGIPAHASAFCDNVASQCAIIDAECTNIRNGGHNAVADDCDTSVAACNAVEADCREAAANCPFE